MKLTKTRVQKLDAQWRRFVFYSRFTRVVFWFGVALFPVALFLSEPIRDFLMRRVFSFWFGCFLIYLASAFLLNAVASLLRREVLTALWVGLWAVFLSFAAKSAFVLALSRTASP